MKAGNPFLPADDNIDCGVPLARLSEREQGVCRRVREARELRSVTQQECAQQTGIQRSTLANYEALVTPLGYDEGKRLCYRLDINQRWLATGLPPRTPYFDLSPNLEFSIAPNSLFSKAFDEVLADPIEEQVATLIRLVGRKAFLQGKYDNAVFNQLTPAGESMPVGATLHLANLLRLRVNWMPEEFKTAFAQTLLKAQEQFFLEHGAEIEKRVRARQRRAATAEAALEMPDAGLAIWPTESAIATAPSGREEVEPLWPALKQRLRQATLATGKKTELANYLKVELSLVSRWLSDAKTAREPGAEYALRMQRWLQQQKPPSHAASN